MGFFSSIWKGIKSVGRFAGGLLGLGTSAVKTAAPVVRRAVPAVAGGLLAGGGFALGERLLSPGEPGFEEQQQALMAAGGNGRFVTATIVQTFDRMSGKVVKQETLKGSPFLMNRDIAVAKRVMRTATKLGGKFSRKTRMPSKTKMLTDAVIDRAIGSALQPVTPHHHPVCAT